MQSYSREKAREGKTIGFVPTMGYLHEGHLALVRRARRDCDVVVVSIFVNPTQFAPGEDYESYPRDEARDLSLLEKEGVDAVFLPEVDEMYPGKSLTRVSVAEMTEPMCGRYRPGHFDGVTTVVAKLFNIVLPHRAYFGEKDYQQLKVVEKMVQDLNFPVEIVPVPTVREPDGLAMSSRNTYLSEEERRAAPLIYQALAQAEQAFKEGERSAEKLADMVRQKIEANPLFRLQYVEVRDAETLEEIKNVDRPAVVAVAAFLGKARLIDNIVLGRED